MNATDVLCYTYEADYHCTPCAIARFGEHPRSPIAHPWIADESIDSEGNTPAPVFGDSEWWDPHSEVHMQVLRCCDCHKVIDHTREWSPASFFQPLRLYLERNPGQEALPWEYMGTDERGTYHYKEREEGNRVKLTATGRLAAIHEVVYRKAFL
jgi:hypothetical protein